MTSPPGDRVRSLRSQLLFTGDVSAMAGRPVCGVWCPCSRRQMRRRGAVVHGRISRGAVLLRHMTASGLTARHLSHIGWGGGSLRRSSLDRSVALSAGEADITKTCISGGELGVQRC